MEAKLTFNRAFREGNESRARYVVLRGGAGSGKSVNTAQLYVLRLLSERGRNLLVLRKSESSNRYSTYAELCGAIGRAGLWGYFEARLNPLEIACVNGNRAVFRGMNDAAQREKLKSISFPSGKLTDVWLEEATEFTREDVELVDDRLRGELPEGLFFQLRLTFNPISAAHWIKRYFFDTPSPDVYTHVSTFRDNAFIDDAYARRMERRRATDPDGYAVYALGEWGGLSGLILTNWETRELSDAAEDYDAVFAGQDFGFNHYNVILKVGFKDGDIYVLSEQADRELDTGEIIAGCTLDRRVLMYCDSAEPDRIKTFRAAGFRAVGVSKEPGSVAAQIDYLKGRRIFVAPSCVVLIRELSMWRWLRDERTGEYTDIPAPTEDDAIAALRYAIEGVRKERRIEAVGRLLRW